MQPIIALKEIKHFLKTRVQQLLRGWSCSRSLNQNNIFFSETCVTKKLLIVLQKNKHRYKEKILQYPSLNLLYFKGYLIDAAYELFPIRQRHDAVLPQMRTVV